MILLLIFYVLDGILRCRTGFQTVRILLNRQLVYFYYGSWVFETGYTGVIVDSVKYFRGKANQVLSVANNMTQILKTLNTFD